MSKIMRSSRDLNVHKLKQCYKATENKVDVWLFRSGRTRWMIIFSSQWGLIYTTIIQETGQYHSDSGKLAYEKAHKEAPLLSSI